MSTAIKGEYTRRVILLIIAVLVAAAIILQFSIGKDNEREAILDMLASYGYRVNDDAIYIAGSYKDKSVEELLPEAELKSVIETSKKAGFPSDVQKKGEITLILVALRDERVITLYFLDGKMNLGFIQKQNSEAVESLGEAVND